MTKHKVYHQRSSEKLRLQRKRQWLRQHVRSDGAPKMRYTPAEADEVVAEISRRRPLDPVSAYACPICGWMHVGRQRSRDWTGRVDPVVVLESGDRVEACIRMENTGSQRARFQAILSRCKSVEARRITSTPTVRRSERRLP